LVIATTNTTTPQPIQFWTNNTERMRVTATGHVLPGADNMYDFGSSSLRWANVYGVNGSFSSLTVSGLASGSVIFAGTGGALSQNNANFYWDNANARLGIGTATPNERLDVAGNVQFSGALMPAGNAGTSGQVLVSQGAGTPPVWQSVSSLVNAWSLNGNSITPGDFLGTTNAQPLVIRTSNVERLRVTATGNVVVQNQAPTGATKVIIQAGANQSGVNLLEWQDNLGNILGVIDANGLVGIGTATPGQNLHVEGNGSVSAVFVNGGVGVGTINPSATLDVDGTVAFSGTAMLTNTGIALTLPSNVAVVEIEDGGGAANINVNPPTSGTQGQVLFIRYSGTQNLTLVGVLPNGLNQTATAQFHAILMYIGGDWRLMSFVD